MLIITLSFLATCLVSSNCSVTHVRWGEGTSSVLFQWRPAFSALWRCGNSVVSVHHINNFWNTRLNLTKFSGQSPQWLRIVCAKLHVKRLGIDWDINKKRSADVWRCRNSVVSVHHNNNFWNTRLNLTKFSGQSPQWLRIVCAKLHVKRLGIDWDINKKRSAGVVTTLAQCFTLITFEVLNQTPPNLLGSCGSSTRWYLRNYIKNGWELTSELTSKWIYI